ncbi:MULTISPECIES: FUSC family protein [unclassified Bradyrhizobium]|uniref:FUSC family protein n=1 Tax=Bradyrhizobium TaxID=374 RepID=UPI0028E3A195|nr:MULTISPECIES: FUSC family protein [unclassified Bradyrhizobium]
MEEWAAVATLFVLRETRQGSLSSGISRLAATFVSFVLCFIYIALSPVNAAGIGLVIGLGAIVMMVLGRHEDMVTIGITTTVVLVVAAIDPKHALAQPSLRLLDTVVGIRVGTLAKGPWPKLTSSRLPTTRPIRKRGRPAHDRRRPDGRPADRKKRVVRTLLPEKEVPILIVDTCDGYPEASHPRDQRLVRSARFIHAQRFYIFKLALSRPDASTGRITAAGLEDMTVRANVSTQDELQAMLPTIDLVYRIHSRYDVCTAVRGRKFIAT